MAFVTPAAALPACGDDPDALVLDVTADHDATRLRVEVKGPTNKDAVSVEFDVDPGDTGRDISDPKQAYQLALRFVASGHYGVHIVDISSGPPSQSWAGEFDVSGVTHGDAHLVAIGPGDDSDGDGWPENCPDGTSACLHDCNDGDPNTHPFAVDLCEDGIDQDCSGSDRTCEDADMDGYDETTDCDDNDPSVNPGVHESSTTCDGPDPKCDNGKDDNCDGTDSKCHIDMDCDGHYPVSDGGDDCDDNDASRYPGAIDVCGDNIDQDCDGTPDDGCQRCDEDGDGEFGNHPERGCSAPPDQLDCDDSDRSVNHHSTDDCGGSEGAPACAARGYCKGNVDDDCDGQVNEGCPPASCDADSDGFAIASCPTPPPAGMADCNDNDPHVYPGAPDICGDAILQNCSIDLPCSTDADHDGYNAGADCNDADPSIHPWAIEACDGKDQNCNGVIDEGNPGVTAGTTLDSSSCTFDNDGACASPAGRCVCSSTLSDGKMDPGGNRVMCPGETAGAWGPRCFGAVQPAYESCDGADRDCNGTNDDPTGANLDPAILGVACDNLPAPCVQGHVIGCDFSMSHPYFTNPHYVCSSDEMGPKPETCNGVDDNCSGQIDEGFGLGTPCDGADGDLCKEGVIACDGAGGTLCNDNTVTNTELCNLIDDNCNGQTDEGFALGVSCDGPDTDLCKEGVTICNLAGNGTVCSDQTGNNVELCNGVDDDCNGQTDDAFPTKGQACDGGDTDLCKEGVFVCNGPGTDVVCNDNTGNNVELCNNLDDDCDGMIDEDFPQKGMGCDGADGDMCIEGTWVCNGTILVCTDMTSTTTETCNNLDDDCNTVIDDGSAGTSCLPTGDTCASGGNCRCGAGPICSGLSDTCSSGNCKCGSGAACSATNSSACVSGACKCGVNPACTGMSDTCASGTCKCGVNPACTSATADACNAGVCQCGGAAACDPTISNNCTGGMCRCGANPECTGLSDTCSSGTCLCGTNPSCDPTVADNCKNGACKCGNSPACGMGKTCVGGNCQ